MFIQVNYFKEESNNLSVKIVDKLSCTSRLRRELVLVIVPWFFIPSKNRSDMCHIGRTQVMT